MDRKEKEFSIAELGEQFVTGLRGADIIMFSNKSKSPNHVLHAIKPVKRLYRQNQIPFSSFLKRSGFNKSIDKPSIDPTYSSNSLLTLYNNMLGVKPKKKSPIQKEYIADPEYFMAKFKQTYDVNKTSRLRNLINKT